MDEKSAWLDVVVVSDTVDGDADPGHLASRLRGSGFLLTGQWGMRCRPDNLVRRPPARGQPKPQRIGLETVETKAAIRRGVPEAPPPWGFLSLQPRGGSDRPIWSTGRRIRPTARQ